MPTIFSHGIFALALGRVYTARWISRRFWVLSAVCAMLPDADVFGFAFGVRYGDLLGHRGLTHSLFFAVLLGLLIASAFFREAALFSKSWWALVLYFSLVTASHGFLDSMTDGGLGVAFFSPFDRTRYFLPWRPIEVSPIGLGFFSERGVEVLLSEITYVWLPSLLLIIAAWLCRKLLASLRH